MISQTHLTNPVVLRKEAHQQQIIIHELEAKDVDNQQIHVMMGDTEKKWCIHKADVYEGMFSVDHYHMGTEFVLSEVAN